MDRRRVVLACGALAVLLLGCGDDPEPRGAGGDQSAPPPALQRLLTEIEEAPVDVTAPPTTLGAGAEGFDHGVAALRVLGDDPRLDELAVDCHQGDLSSCDVLYVGSPDDSLYETYGATCGARVDQATHRLCADLLVGAPGEPPRTGDAFTAELARQCAAGDMLDCDLLFATAETNSEAERYGATCGGRLETDDDCVRLVT